jgi:hypothetical protein
MLLPFLATFPKAHLAGAIMLDLRNEAHQVNCPLSGARSQGHFGPVMADNPGKKRADSKRRSQQKHEVAYRRSRGLNLAGRMKRGMRKTRRAIKRAMD